MPLIQLTQGKFAKVSSEDFLELNRHKWYAYKTRGIFYAGRTIYPDGTKKRGKILQMHVAILGKEEGKEIDHKDRDGLNNSRSNLHFVTHSTNCRNRRKKLGTHSRFVGVSKNNKTGSWLAYIKTDGKLKHLGSFKTEHEALNARKLAEENILN